jgi:hypothetical protein
MRTSSVMRDAGVGPRCCRLGIAVVLLAGLCRAQSPTELLRKDYEKQVEEELIATGQRHVNLGWKIRNSGLQQQATWQFLRAVEASKGKHQGAQMVLNATRTYGDVFWRKARKKASKASLLDYEKKAAAAELDDRQGQVKLAKAAGKARLHDQAFEHWVEALKLGAKVEIQKDVARVDGEAVPLELAERLQKVTIEVNGGQRRFDAVGAKAPRLPAAVEFGDERLVVRTDLGLDTAKVLHALGLALWGHLQDRLDGAPVRPLRLFVFAKRADYDAYLQASGNGAAAGGSGLCDYGAFQTLVAAEGLAEADLHALVLHELSHLFFFGSSPVAMPDWYAEGFAECFGGQGTFRWDGKALAVGAPMRADRVAAVKQAPMTLRQLLAGDAESLLATDHAQGMRFYAQCMLFQRWLLEAKNPWRERFLDWELQCRGKLDGASMARLGDPKPAQNAFDAAFGKDLDAMEKAFRVWLDGQ